MIEDLIIYVKVVVTKDIMKIIIAYAHQIGAKSHIKDKFWADIEG